MSGKGFGKDLRLLNSRDFNYLRHKSQSVSTRFFKTYFKPTRMDDSRTRVGFSISKKVGKAVVRNRLRRMFREDFRLSEYRELGVDMLIIVSPRIKGLLDNDEKGYNIAREGFKELLSKVDKKLQKNSNS